MSARNPYTKWLLVGVLGAFVLIALPATGFAEEGTTTDVDPGVEPGDGCAALAVGRTCSAVHGAPMQGEAKVTWLGNTAGISGRVNQFGSGGCFIQIIDPAPPHPLNPVLFEQGGIDTFNALEAQDLRGACLEEITIETSGGTCVGSDTSFAEVLAANQLTRLADEDAFIVEVLVLPIRCTDP